MTNIFNLNGFVQEVFITNEVIAVEDLQLQTLKMMYKICVVVAHVNLWIAAHLTIIIYQ